uniref:NADH-ubiquinone oxidoreductase chain 2 n=1 Tax=Stricticollis tobias TaxID=879048 RepID=A0A343C1X0_9CUCU|nr:NADH dehydrogenase subunit 2 [Stricticollis tobias]
MIFANSMIIGTLISISSYSWMGMWMGLEINLLSIIPLINSSKNMFSSESSLKYFLTQALASLILLFSITMLLNETEFIMPEMNSSSILMMNSALLTKLGAAPFHFWFAEVMEGMNWINCLILLTWQKIAPMILIMNNSINKNILMISILSSLIISTILSMNQTSLRKILTFSSINHIAWMLAASISFTSWLIYFIVYSVTSVMMVWILNSFKSFYVNQLINIKMNKNLKLSLMINFLSLGGLPPFLGFLPKWIVIMNLINQNQLILTLIMILFTLVMLFVYTRLIYSSMIISHNEMKPYLKIQLNTSLPIMNFISLSSLVICPLILT